VIRPTDLEFECPTLGWIALRSTVTLIDWVDLGYRKWPISMAEITPMIPKIIQGHSKADVAVNSLPRDLGLFIGIQ
jgi:hypothetical protein